MVGKTPFPGSERWYCRYILYHSYSKCIIVSIKYVSHVYMCIYSYTCTYIHNHVQIYTHASTYSVMAWQGRVRISHWSLVIGIDHDTVCAGVVGTAIRNSTSCAGRRTAACGRAGRHNECCSGLQYQPRQRRPYKWSISILPRSQFTKSKGNLRFRCLVPLFVPIGVCVTTHDDGTASDVTIGMWFHN